MPPRKKQKASTNATATPVPDGDVSIVDTPAIESEAPIHDPLNDLWTDEQETSLFTGIMKWKPNGMHKHFRMIALSEHLRNHGYDPRVHTHTSITGIWAKLDTMYNMSVIDERENSFAENDDDPREKLEVFKLPEEWDEYMFMRGKKPASSSEAPSSPGQLHVPITHGRKRQRGDTVTARKTRASTVEDTDERESSVQTPPPKAASTRSGRATAKSKGKAAAVAAAAELSRSRQLSKETSVDEESEDGEDAEDETQNGEDDDTPSPKAPKAKSRGKADQTAARKSKRKK